MAEHIIRVENLTKIYGSGEIAVAALDGVNLQVHAGEALALLFAAFYYVATLLPLALPR